MKRRPRASARRRPGQSQEIDLEIAKLGSEGVGVGYHDGQAVVVPGALPGEWVRVALFPGAREARITAVLTASADRIEPVCRHFGACGGCALQHLSALRYDEFKRDLVAAALRRQGLAEVEIAPGHISPPGSRRRAILEASRRGEAVSLGFSGRASHLRIDLDECPILEPALVALLAPLRRLLRGCLGVGEHAGVHLTLLDTGVDLGLALTKPPDLAMLEQFAVFADAQDLCRLWWRAGEEPAVPAAIRRPPLITFGAVPTVAPMGGFLQATAAGQGALTTLVTAAAAGASRIADLFAGSGTFSLPLAAMGASVHAVESDAAALGALSQTARTARLPGVTTERRDLDMRPLPAEALGRFDLVIFDPPRAGARAQAEQIAAAPIDRAIGVSCNPATFARDAAILIGGGWRLDRVTPVDQFLWSPHIELVGVFSRPS